MFLDKLLEIADAVSIAAGAGSVLVGDQIDMQVVRDLGVGKPVYLVVQTATEIITAGTAGTLEFHLVSDDAAAIATNGSASVHAKSPSYVTDDSAANSAQLNAGGIPWIVALPMEGVAYERYLGLLAVIGGQTITAGAVNAFLTLDVSKWKAYPDAI